MAETPCIFDYVDHKPFLKAWYDYQKKAKRISMRIFSKRAGFSSSNFLKLVMDGKRNLSVQGAQKFCKALKLTESEKGYFLELVHYNQAQTPELREIHFHRMMNIGRFNNIQKLGKDHYYFCSQWYHPVVRELVTSKDYIGPGWLAEKIFPMVSPKDVEKSIALLERLGMIRKNGKQWEQTNPLVTTGKEITSPMVTNFHREMLALVRDLIPQAPYEASDISAIVVGLPKSAIPKLREKIREFRDELLKTIAGYPSVKEVAVLCMQFLPLTKWKENSL